MCVCGCMGVFVFVCVCVCIGSVCVSSPGFLQGVTRSVKVVTIFSSKP